MKKIFRKFTLLLLLVPMLNSCELDPIDYSPTSYHAEDSNTKEPLPPNLPSIEER